LTNSTVLFAWSSSLVPIGFQRLPWFIICLTHLSTSVVYPRSSEQVLNISHLPGIEYTVRHVWLSNLLVCHSSEKDYPPKANAGSNKIISLPKNAVTLFGNGSTDDKGIISYEWTKTSDSVKLAADMRVGGHMTYMSKVWSGTILLLWAPISIVWQICLYF